MTEEQEFYPSPDSPGWSKGIEGALAPLFAAAQLGLPHLVDEDEVRDTLRRAGYSIKSEDQRRVRLPEFEAPVVMGETDEYYEPSEEEYAEMAKEAEDA